MNKRKSRLKIGINERPSLGLGALLSVQHLTAMFSANILIPMIIGLPVSVALFASGLGTLIYLVITKFKVPVYLGSSGAYVAALLIAKEAMGGSMAAGQTGLILVGLSYVLTSIIVRKTGTDWVNKLIPAVIVGPLILVIGLSLAPYAIEQTGLLGGATFKDILVVLITLGTTIYFIVKGKGFMSFVPFLAGIVAGYLAGAMLGMVDFSPVLQAELVRIPEFSIWGIHYKPYFGPEAWAIVPVILVSLSEHVGDHLVLGEVCGQNFLEEPGMHRTVMGDGVATIVSAFLGGPANTTYGENTGVISTTKVGSVYVIAGAAVLAIIMSFSGTVSALIYSIPAPVLGGVSLLLYGVIATNGLKVLKESNVDFNENRNIIIISVMLILGLGGAAIPLFGSATLSGAALAGIVGVILNRILPQSER